MKPISHELRKKIKTYIKNKLDISELIKDIDIKKEDLSGAIISKFDRINDNISGCNLARAIIGKEGELTQLSNTKMLNCCFKGTRFLGRVWFRKVDARGSNFSEAWLPYVEYQYADLRDCTFCSTIFPIGSREGYKAKFSKNFFKELTKAWIIE